MPFVNVMITVFLFFFFLKGNDKFCRFLLLLKYAPLLKVLVFFMDLNKIKQIIDITD